MHLPDIIRGCSQNNMLFFVHGQLQKFVYLRTHDWKYMITKQKFEKKNTFILIHIKAHMVTSI